MTIIPDQNKTGLREAAWDYIQSQTEFRAEDIARATGCAASTAQNWIYQWEKEKLIRIVRSEIKKRFYRVTGKHAPLPPSFRTDMSAVPNQTIQGNLWRTMRMMKQFSPVDLAIHSTTDEVDVTDQAAKEYCRMLLRAGYLRVVEKAIPGRRDPLYRLINNTGPKPPVEKRIRAVYDSNRDEFTHIAGGRL